MSALITAFVLVHFVGSFLGLPANVVSREEAEYTNEHSTMSMRQALAGGVTMRSFTSKARSAALSAGGSQSPFQVLDRIVAMTSHTSLSMTRTDHGDSLARTSAKNNKRSARSPRAEGNTRAHGIGAGDRGRARPTNYVYAEVQENGEDADETASGENRLSKLPSLLVPFTSEQAAQQGEFDLWRPDSALFRPLML
eukprot:scpid88831/ scgid27303/ 